MLSNEAKETFFNDGFTAEEIKILNDAMEVVDPQSSAWSQTRMTRREWVDSMVKRGFRLDDVRRMIEDFYIARRNVSPWDFLRATYPELLRRGRLDYSKAKMQRARRKIAPLYGM